MATHEIHIHIHEGQSDFQLHSPEPRRQKRTPRPNVAPDIKTAMSRSWWRRDMGKAFNDGFSAWEKLEGTRPVERADMNVELEGDDMEFIMVTGKGLQRGFEAGFARHLSAKRMAVIVRQNSIALSQAHPEKRDSSLRYGASTIDFMPRITDGHKAELKALVLNEELPLAS